MKPQAKKFYNISNNGDTVDVVIYGVITSWKWSEADVSAFDFRKDFAEATKNAKHVNIRINSPGGDVFEGAAIANIIRDFKGTTTAIIDGVAASMAAVIALSANATVMYDNAMFMLHSASSVVWGNSKQMRKEADVLDKVDESLSAIISAKTGFKKDEVIAKYMDGEDHWMTAGDAKAANLIDRIEDKKATLPDGAIDHDMHRMMMWFENQIGKAQQNEFPLSGLLRSFAALFTNKNKPEDNTPMTLTKLKDMLSTATDTLQLSAQAITDLRNEVTNHEQSMSIVQNDLKTAQTELQKAKDELAAAQKKITDLQALIPTSGAGAPGVGADPQPNNSNDPKVRYATSMDAHAAQLSKIKTPSK